MWAIIIGAIVNLLIYFFEQWWTNNHPWHPAQYRAAFLNRVSGIRYFWMGRDRVKKASLLFDKFQKNYEASPPPPGLTNGPKLTKGNASFYAKKYATGLTLTQAEMV